MRCLFFAAATFWLNTALADAASLASDTSLHCLSSSTATPVSIARVTDGDTVVLSDQRRVRLIGINTLELNSSLAKDKQWALAAKVELEKQIQSKQILLLVGLDEFDRHGRTLAHLQREDGSSVAQTLISKGLGLSITVGQNHRCAAEYERSEKTARQKKRGIWQEPGTWLNDEQPLTGRERGFRLLTSTVVSSHDFKNRTVLELRNGLRVTLNKHFLAAQTQTDARNQSLLGRRIEVRGWLSQKSGKQRLTLSHPTTLSLLP